MSAIGFENLYDTSFTLYRCSPLFNFKGDPGTFIYFEGKIAEILCKKLGLYLDGQEDPGNSVGKITSLHFRPFELEGFEYDQSQNESEPLKFELEYQLFKQKTPQKQSLIMLPAIEIPEGHKNDLFWFYPLVLSKLSNAVFQIFTALINKEFDARMELLQIPPRILESLVIRAVESIYRSQLNEFEYLEEFMDMPQFSSLLLQYATHHENVKIFRVKIEASQVLKLTKLIGDSKKVYAGICEHIMKGTKFKITAVQFDSVSCHIASLSVTSKMKIHQSASTRDVYSLLYQLIDLATARKDVLIWV